MEEFISRVNHSLLIVYVTGKGMRRQEISINQKNQKNEISKTIWNQNRKFQ